MSSKERQILERLVKSWAQDHTPKYVISDPEDSNQGLINTSGFLTWVIRENYANVDLLSLVDQLEAVFKKNSGLFCGKCHTFYEFAESNQQDGSLVCYSCRLSPYH